MKRALLLDVSAMMYRAYYANMNMRTKEMPTGAVYGFLLSLFQLLKEYEPEYMAAAFDIKRSHLKRTELYAEYKSNRDTTPEDLVKQIPYIEAILDAFGIQRIKIDGYEADDILGSLSTKLSKKGIPVTIVTGDKDISQLLDENTEIYLLGKEVLKTREDVKNYIDVYPEKIPDLFGLIGDSSDCIPGVRKIGPKKAVPMLEKYGNLEGIYENIDKLSELPGVGKTLIQIMKEDKELAFLSRSLAKIERNLDFPFSLEELQFEKKEEALREIFQKLEFKSFLKRLGNEETKEEKSLLQGNLFSASPRAEKESRTEVKEKNLEKKIIKSFEELKKEMEDFSEEDKILLLYDRLGITCTFSQKNLYLPFFHEGLLGNNLDLEECKQFFSTLKGKIYTYHLKELYKLGFSFSKPVYDMMIAYHLVSSQTKEDYTLIGQYYLKKIAEDEKTVFAKQKLESLSAEVYGDFLLNRADVLYSCLDILEEDVKEKELEAVLWETELPLIPVLADMERIGIKIDRKYFEAYSLELTEKLALLEKAIWEEAGEEFNLNSPKQLGEILFLKLNLPTGKKTKTGFSTDVEVLEHLSSQGFQIASNLLEYRKLAKLKNTYVDPIPKMTGEGDRIHTCYHQIGTVTGRLSSSDPNLQNIPVKTEEGIRIRQGFIAREGWKLLSIDYSQVELRVLASLSKDENLLKAYQEKQDLHSVTAKRIFELQEDEEVSREQRIMAKIINFSIIYGKTPFGLAKELGISVKDAGEYIKRYFAQYPRVAQFERQVITFAEEHGYVETYFGRRRIIDGIHSKNKMVKSQAERMAVNTVVQGTAAEILKKVMIKIYFWLSQKTDIHLLLQVHDELIFEIQEGKLQEYEENLIRFMRETIQLEEVELEVNTNIGDTWAEAK